MKKITVYFIIFAMLICISACRPEENPYAGYCTDGVLEGGASISEANARELKLWEENGCTKLKLTFNVGSRMSGGGQEDPASTLPAYRVYRLTYPSRLVVEFDALGYTDFERCDFVPAGCVVGSFVHRMEGEVGAAIYFQLTADAAFRSFGSGNVLEIEIKPMEAPEKKKEDGQEKYLVTADAYSEFCAGKIAAEGMTPTYDADMSRVLLVSDVMESDIAAELFVNKIAGSNVNAVREEWTIIPAEYGMRPVYDETLAYKAAFSENVIRVNGEEAAAEVFIPDGWYLADIPKRYGGGALYARRVADSEGYKGDRLYMRAPDGTLSLYFDFDFQTVESAAFSPDGRKMAVMERAAETTNLYIFDMETEDLLTNLTDTGFGNTVSAYTWDDLGTTLYAVSGNDSMQIHQYDFNVPDETKRHGVVEKNGADEGSIAYCGGNVYFVQGDMKKGDVIYRVKCDGGVRKEFACGSAFAISGDNAYMAVNAESGIAEASSAEAKFRIIDMETGESRTVTDSFGPQDFVWSKDCTRVYFFENRMAGEGGEGAEDAAPQEETGEQNYYHYTLWMYDAATGESREIADLPSTAIFPGDAPGYLYLNYNDPDTLGEKVRATYVINADSLISGN